MIPRRYRRYGFTAFLTTLMILWQFGRYDLSNALRCSLQDCDLADSTPEIQLMSARIVEANEGTVKHSIGTSQTSPEYPINSIAIATTVLFPDPSLPIWLDYHLRRVSVILIFMDDPAEQPNFEALIGNRPVILFNGSAAAPEVTVESRLIYRQGDNTQVAVQFCLEHNITWLLHIDIDELFYENGNQSWQSWDDVGSVQFVNHEAIPLSYESDAFFYDCNLFRIDGGSSGFIAYVHGKSAVRITPGVEAFGPHLFKGYQGEERYIREPMILHYPTATFDRWKTKFRVYRDLADFWFGNPEREMIWFMKESRDVFREAEATGNWDKAYEFYLSVVPDVETARELVESGDLGYINPFDD